MHGVGEIRRRNQDPHGRPTEEHFGTRFVGEDIPKTEAAPSTKTPRSSAGNLAVLTLLDKLFSVKAEANELEELAGVATILDTFGVEHPINYDDAKALAIKLATQAGATSQGRIQPGIDQPPFINFWANLNAKRERAGLPEALYKEARTLFYGGVTPLGAMTFVGKEWDGVRAVPATPVTRLGGSRPIYHGEHREITGDRGTLWHKVTEPSGVVSYACPEAALVAAKDAKQAMIDWKFR